MGQSVAGGDGRIRRTLPAHRQQGSTIDGIAAARLPQHWWKIPNARHRHARVGADGGSGRHAGRAVAPRPGRRASPDIATTLPASLFPVGPATQTGTPVPRCLARGASGPSELARALLPPGLEPGSRSCEQSPDPNQVITRRKQPGSQALLQLPATKPASGRAAVSLAGHLLRPGRRARPDPCAGATCAAGAWWRQLRRTPWFRAGSGS